VPVNPEEDDMRTVKLGATRLEVTPIAYGTWQFGGDWGPVDEWAAVSAIEHARSLGINFSDTAQIDEFAAVLPVETVQPPYHLFRRDIETSLLPYAEVHDIGVLVAWVLANPAVQVAIVGARTPAHLDESVGALDLRLGQDDRGEIDQLMTAAVPVGGPSPEGMS
jgi:aryl-alcohol dehydrogenase-like predicted oxidoreductase